MTPEDFTAKPSGFSHPVFPQGLFSTTEADFAALAETLFSESLARVDATDASEEGEGRRSPRNPFLCVQMIGFIDGENLPRAEEFQQITCDNISRGGIAFRQENAPDFEHCVIALGRPPERTYLLARVAHVQPVFRVGCQFLRKLLMDPRTGRLIDPVVVDSGGDTGKMGIVDDRPR